MCFKVDKLRDPHYGISWSKWCQPEMQAEKGLSRSDLEWDDARFMEMRARSQQEGMFKGWSKKGRILRPPGHGSSSTGSPLEPHSLRGSLAPCSLLARQSWSAHSWQYGLLNSSSPWLFSSQINEMPRHIPNVFFAWPERILRAEIFIGPSQAPVSIASP